MRKATLVLMTIVMACGLIVSQAPAAEFRSSGRTIVQEIAGFQVESFFDVFTELSVDGGGQWTVDSFFDVFTELTVGTELVSLNLAGPATTRITRGQEAGTFDTEIVSMSLMGEVPGAGPVTVGLGQELSRGEVRRTRVGTEMGGDGRFAIDSFFDISYEIEIPGGTGPIPGSERVDGVPNPGGQRHDAFSGRLTPNGVGDDGTGQNTGWNDGQWFPYPETPGPTWWNEWFYNDPLDMTRQKEIYYDITLAPAEGNIGGPVEVAINWSEPGWTMPAAGGPPMEADEANIGRDTIWAGIVELDATGGPVRITRIEGTDDPFRLLFNPEWISIDIRFADGTTMLGDVMIDGQIWHECVPEPTTMALLALGGLAVLRKRRKR